MKKIFNKNVIAEIVSEYLENNSTKTPADIYSKIPGLKRQNFCNKVKQDRLIAPTHWRGFRVALGMNKKDFWSKIQRFYDGD